VADDRTKWTPQANQRKLLNYVQGKQYDCHILDACAECEIGRRTYYDWFDNPDFVQWWQAEHERFFTLGLNEVHAAIRDGAVGGKRGGNTAAQKLYLERFDAGYMPKSKQEIDGRVTIEGLIAELDDETGEGNATD